MLKTRTYGDSGSWVVLLHGGPAAWGYLSPVAEVLAEKFRVLEPFQRTGPGHPIKVSDHIADLEEVIRHFCPAEKVTLLGHSWGAMLALAYAAFSQKRLNSLVLVGCGAFDLTSRELMQRTLKKRMTQDLQKKLNALNQKNGDPDRNLAAMGLAIRPLYCLDARPQPELPQCNAMTHHETWQDMLKCQEKRIYPQAFACIDLPAIMLHGEYDPHPGREIHRELKKYIPHMEFRQWQDCGHDPWLEKRVSRDFYDLLIRWLSEKSQT